MCDFGRVVIFSFFRFSTNLSSHKLHFSVRNILICPRCESFCGLMAAGDGADKVWGWIRGASRGCQMEARCIV